MTYGSNERVRSSPVDVHVSVDDEGRVIRMVDAHRRFGGLDVGASIAGTLAALGVTVLLGGLLGGIGTIGYQLDLERGTDELSAAGLAGGLVTLLVAFLIGGWVAGRIARYDGGRNGLMTAVWFILVAAALAALGAWLGDRYDVFADLQVPQWFSDNATTVTSIVTGVVAAAVMLGAGFVGGRIGTRYHARADAYLAAETRDELTGPVPGPATGVRRGDLRNRSATGLSDTAAAPDAAAPDAAALDADRAEPQIDLRDHDRERAAETAD